MRKLLLVLLLLFSTLALSLTTYAQAEPDTVVLAFSRQPDSLFIDYAITSTAGFAMQVIYNSLVTPGPDGTYVGELAESWEVSDDQLTWTFHLRSDVKWHDGEPLTAEDVRYSYTYAADAEYTGALAPVVMALKGAQAYKDGAADHIEGINVIDDYTVAFTTDQPNALFLDIQGQRYIMPSHLLKDIPVIDLASSPQAHQPIGTGPYRVVEWKTDEAIIYERFDDYFGEKAKIKNYIWKIIPEKSVHVTELLGGTVDIVPEVLADDFPSLQGDDTVETLQIPGVNFTLIELNGLKPFFSDVRVRQALNYAIDKQAIINAVGGGFGTAVTNIVHPSLPEFNPNLAGYPYNLEKAKALLAEAGWTDDDGDGIVESHGVAGLDDGTPFSFELGTLNFSPYDLSAQIVQQAWKAVGVEAILNVVEFNIYFSEYLTGESDYEAGISGWFNFEQTPQGELETNFGQNQALNWSHWSGTSEFEEIIANAPAEFDVQKRIEMYWRAEELVEAGAPWINLTRLDNLISYNNKLFVPEIGSLTQLFASVPQWEWQN